MKLINATIFSILAAGLPLAAQANLAPPQTPPAKTPPQGTDSCDTKGCPKLDQNGKPPVSCNYTSDMATGWQCILICTYKNTTWGTTVDSSYCN